jgi:hypothetical protein
MIAAIHQRREGYALVPFYCLVRGGNIAHVPEGPCVVEIGERNAAICWESPPDTRRVEIPVERLEELVKWRKLRLGPVKPA